MRGARQRTWRTWVQRDAIWQIADLHAMFPARPAGAKRMGSFVKIGRKAEVLAYIIERIVRDAVSPTMGEIAKKLDVSDTRAKALVRQLELDGEVRRTPGAQRGIVIVNFDRVRERLLAILVSEGYTVNPGTRELFAPGAFPQEHLPLLPDLEHIPDV